MRIVLAKKIGFCFGVRRAVGLAEKALRENEKVYSLGSIIHNRQVVDALSKKGLRVVRDIGGIKRGTVVISSHGISPEIAKNIKTKGLGLIDTTCPFVLNAQMIARSLSNQGYKVIIVGEAAHPEVKALVGFVSKDALVVKDKKIAEGLKLKDREKISIISQTTQSTKNFSEVVKAILKSKLKDIKIINTICKDTEERQKAARMLAKSVDAMVVVGGRNSANTKRLFAVCKEILKNSHLVETEKDLKKSWFKHARVVGVTSGASTPDWIVKKVINEIKKSNRKGLFN